MTTPPLDMAKADVVAVDDDSLLVEVDDIKLGGAKPLTGQQTKNSESRKNLMVMIKDVEVLMGKGQDIILLLEVLFCCRCTDFHLSRSTFSSSAFRG